MFFMIKKVIFLQKRVMKQRIKNKNKQDFNKDKILKFYIICEKHYVQQCV